MQHVQIMNYNRLGIYLNSRSLCHGNRSVLIIKRLKLNILTQKRSHFHIMKYIHLRKNRSLGYGLCCNACGQLLHFEAFLLQIFDQILYWFTKIKKGDKDLQFIYIHYE